MSKFIVELPCNIGDIYEYQHSVGSWKDIKRKYSVTAISYCQNKKKEEKITICLTELEPSVKNIGKQSVYLSEKELKFFAKEVK